jgi:5-carboxymethyl-2-hydroxymuconate isomerase
MAQLVTEWSQKIQDRVRFAQLFRHETVSASTHFMGAEGASRTVRLHARRVVFARAAGRSNRSVEE